MTHFMLKPHILDFYGAGKGDNMEIVVGKKKIRIKLSGRIDSNNSAEFESDLVDMVSKHADKDVELDMANLEYISSAGLRVLLKLRKMKKKTLDIINVNDDVFEIFGVTGFIELFNLSKRMKSITLMPAEILMRSVNGAFYRQNGDTMVKVYKKGVSLDQVKQESEDGPDNGGTHPHPLRGGYGGRLLWDTLRSVGFLVPRKGNHEEA